MKTIEWRAKGKYRGKLASGPEIFEWSKYRRVSPDQAGKLVRSLNARARVPRKFPAGGHIFEYRVKP